MGRGVRGKGGERGNGAAIDTCGAVGEGKRPFSVFSL